MTWGVTAKAGVGQALCWCPLPVGTSHNSLSTGRGNGFLPTAPPSLQPTPFLSENRYLNEGQYNLLEYMRCAIDPTANGDDASPN